MTFSKARFEAFSDGVFAIAITLLVLEIAVPKTVGSGEWDLFPALLQMWPQYLVYVASFLTVGITWINHHALFYGIETISYRVLVLNLLLLLSVSFIPFPTAVLGKYGLVRPSVIFLGLAFSLLSLAYNAVWHAVIRDSGETVPKATLWNVMGLLMYPVATAAACLNALLGLLLITATSGYYALPHGVKTVHQIQPRS